MNIDAAGKKACWELGRFFILMFIAFYSVLVITFVLVHSFKTNSLIV